MASAPKKVLPQNKVAKIVPVKVTTSEMNNVVKIMTNARHTDGAFRSVSYWLRYFDADMTDIPRHASGRMTPQQRKQYLDLYAERLTVS